MHARLHSARFTKSDEICFGYVITGYPIPHLCDPARMSPSSKEYESMTLLNSVITVGEYDYASREHCASRINQKYSYTAQIGVLISIPWVFDL